MDARDQVSEALDCYDHALLIHRHIMVIENAGGEIMMEKIREAAKNFAGEDETEPDGVVHLADRAEGDTPDMSFLKKTLEEADPEHKRRSSIQFAVDLAV